MIFNIVSAASALVVLGSLTSAAPSKAGQIVQITSSSDWCMMMPPQAGGDIAANEDRAIAFCTNAHSDAPQAQIFPDGFIQSANFAKGNGYVQITGKIDSTKYSLSESDRGGQYDIRAPVGSACAGYNYFVNLIEPHINTMCIRCCKEKKDCNTDKSTYGCAYVIPGDYSGPNTPIQPTATATSATNSASVSATASSATGTVTGSVTIDPIIPTTSGVLTSTVNTTATVTVTGVTPTTATTTATPTVSPNAAARAANSHSAGLLVAAALGVAAILTL
ncbi:hypothetical protein BGX29_004824 [Mortierella sp. GBA35]|nr:hypothetical protein BGX29_004824 [Mortierella sp. GBA35]